MTLLLLRSAFSATHRICIAGELEPVHGHEFRVCAEVAAQDELDASLVLAPLKATLDELAASALEAVARSQGGLPSAERIARHLARALAEALGASSRLRVHALEVEESPGCRARWLASAAGPEASR